MKDVYEYYEKEFEYTSSSSSEFESCSSDLTDASTVSSTVIEEEEHNKIYPPITIDFHESLCYHILKQYQVKNA